MLDFPYQFVIIDMKDKPKKPKKQKETIKTNVDELASDILSSKDENTFSDEIPEIMEAPTDIEQKYEDIPSQTEEPEIIPTPVQFQQGNTKDTAFVVQSHINEMYKILAAHFGPNNGDYFVLNENTTTSTKNNQRKRYKCILVEDKYNFRYMLWFDLTNLGPVY